MTVMATKVRNPRLGFYQFNPYKLYQKVIEEEVELHDWHEWVQVEAERVLKSGQLSGNSFPSERKKTCFGYLRRKLHI